jgi:hypothetical protein
MSKHHKHLAEGIRILSGKALYVFDGKNQEVYCSSVVMGFSGRNQE